MLYHMMYNISKKKVIKAMCLFERDKMHFTSYSLFRASTLRHLLFGDYVPFLLDLFQAFHLIEMEITLKKIHVI